MDKQGIREQLLEDYARLSGRADRIDSHWSKKPPADWEELAVHRQNDEVVEFLDERTRVRLQKIELALKRLDEDEWETCSNCGENIQPARLEALPTTTLCVACAEKVQK